MSHTHHHLNDALERDSSWHQDRIGTLQAVATLCCNPYVDSRAVGFTSSCARITTSSPTFNAGDNVALDHGAAAVVTTIRALNSPRPGAG